MKRLNEQGEFTGRLSVEETEKYYEQLVNPIYTFLNDFIDETNDPSDFIPKDYLFEEIRQYCMRNNLPMPKSKGRIAILLKKNFQNIETAQKTINGKITYVWQYCRFTDAAMQAQLQETIKQKTSENALE